MTEISRFWTGTKTDGTPVRVNEFAAVWSSLLCSDKTTQGPLTDKLNELAPTATGIPSKMGYGVVWIASGMAIVDGILYESTEVIPFKLDVPGSGTRYYTIVLRKDWRYQTVRMKILSPSEVTYPAVTQTSGNIWEIEIARASIAAATGAIITLTDRRTFCVYSRP